MENIERRLELIKMMRNEHKENVGRIQRREHILYPNKKISYLNEEYYGNADYKSIYSLQNKEQSRDDLTSQQKNWGFYIRLGISIGLFLTFFYMERNNISYFGITCDMVQNMISDTFDLKSFAFMK